MLDQTKLPALSVSILNDHFLKAENIPFDTAFCLLNFNISRMLCTNRVKIVIPTGGISTNPNLYFLSLAPSGSGKDRAKKKMEKLFPFMFEDLTAREEAYLKKKFDDAKMEIEKKKLTNGKSHELIDQAIPRTLWPEIGSNATPEGLAAQHNAIADSGFGCVIWRDTEISDTMLKYKGMGPLNDLLVMVKEAYDDGTYNPKVIQGNKFLKANKPVPYIAWLHGAIDSDEGQKLFRRFFTLGFGRRTIVCFADQKEKQKLNVELMMKNEREAMDTKDGTIALLKEIYYRVWSDSNNILSEAFVYTLSLEAEILYVAYRLRSEEDADAMPAQSMRLFKDEMGNRAWRALKLAAIFEAQNSFSKVISAKSMEQAIYVAGYFGNHFQAFMKMRAGSSLAEMLYETIKENPFCRKTFLYNQYYFPGYKTNQKSLLNEALEELREICEDRGEELMIDESNKGKPLFSIFKPEESTTT